ncbi:MAG: hypothetical protein M3R25_11035, partial [Bacteroidota bacterium]|nr:hypothetical protein [Bacteroidota bacterium]
LPFTVYRSPFTIHRLPFTVHRSPLALSLHKDESKGSKGSPSPMFMVQNLPAFELTLLVTTQKA